MRYSGSSIRFAAGFSDQEGAWEKVGERKVQASVFDIVYDTSTGEFLGFSIARYDLEFDKDFQTVKGEVSGEIFDPGVDVLNPGDTAPTNTFTDEFEAKRAVDGNNNNGDD